MLATDERTGEDHKILSEVGDGIGWLTFNNPERRNAVSLAMWQRMQAVVEAFDADPAVRVIVLRGAGDKAFVAGADISRFEQERSSEDAVAHYNAATEAASTALARSPKPTIAMIRGFCVGGGVGIATCCDLRIASDDARFAIPAARLGLGYGYGGLKRLIDIVGPSFAKEIFYTARRFDAEEAAAMGLVNRVVPAGELETYVRDYGARIAANAPLTIAAVKKVVGEALRDPEKRDMAGCDAAVKRCFDSEDYIEGRRAFMEKREPRFTGN